MRTFQQIKHSIIDKFPYFLMIVFIFSISILFMYKRIVIYVYAGERAVLYKPFGGGTQIDKIYGEGVHIINPINKLEKYNIRINIIRHEFGVLTNKGLPITLKIAVRYHPIEQFLGVLHQKVGQKYPDKIILTQIESVMRKGLGQHTPEEVYTNKDQLLSRLITQAIKEIGQNYIYVEDVIIRSVSLPDNVKKAIEHKLVEEQNYLSYAYKILAEKEEAKRKVIESEGIRDYAANVSKTMNQKVLDWQGVKATLELAKSNNAKIVIIGGGKNNLPLILNTGSEEKMPINGKSSDEENSTLADQKVKVDSDKNIKKKENVNFHAIKIEVEK